MVNTHLLSTKSNAFIVLQGFIEMVNTQFNTKVKCIRSDNAFELGSGTKQAEYFLSKGIIHQTNCVGVPQQNGLVERKYKHLLETARALLFQYNLPLNFWGDCVLTATHLINLFPTELLDGKTPYETLNDVIFFKTHFLSLKHIDPSYIFPPIDHLFDDLSSHISTDLSSSSTSSSISHSHNPISINPFHSISSSDQLIPPFDPPDRRSSRSTHPPPYLADSVCNHISTLSTDSQNQPSSCFHTLTNFCFSTLSIPFHEVPLQSQQLVHALDTIHEPSSYTEASKHPAWQEAMLKEFQALEANRTWQIVDLPHGKKPINVNGFTK
ncbi:uncharacterized protein LOC143567510 [Bidens hawaiensis]|uniref:uncharacterized protein LOC143567510 n=1 Tax=Bidens hawaiensis TaxID=980011 RepID=UPI0040490EDA